MKIFFTASARGVQKYGKEYEKMYQAIQKLGHSHVDDVILKGTEDEIFNYLQSVKNNLYVDTLKKIKKADIVILDVSVNSLSMGFVLHHALELGKPVIALYYQGKNPLFLSAIDDSKLQLLEYTNDNVAQLIEEALSYASEYQDVRFNFFISPSIGNYLDWISKEKKIPRSVYLRNLIEKDLIDNDEYNA